MKNTLRKRTFISAIAMLLVSAIVLTSSTFAWFSMAKRVEVEKMQLNITSPDGVQISGNTDAFTTMLTYDDLMGLSGARWDAYDGNTNNFPELLRPSSSVLSFSKSLPVFFEGSVNDSKQLNLYQVADTSSGYVVFDLFVKVSKPETVWFNETTLTCEGNADVPTAMRMAFINCGTVTEKSDAAAISAVLPIDQNGRRATLYEFDSTNHTQHSGYSAGPATHDKYIWAAGNNVKMVDASAEKYYVDDPYNARVTSATGKVNENNVDTEGYISVQTGVNRIRVYLWMEGNDVDCANDVAGATIDFNLVLTLK
ncbi:MAG: hypothetical protein IIU80_01645 [Clostridia bacterium]|nr:hypothetical protein [Clostridia bacterium]